MAGVTLKQLPLPVRGGGIPADREKGAREEEHRRAFEEFVQRFHKNYSAAERPSHFEAFCENFETIKAHNSEHHGYSLGLNEFSDLTPAEFSRIYARPVEEARAERSSGLPLPSLGMHMYKNRSIPESRDWRSQGAVTSIKNQGQCGACWAFSATGAMEGAWKIAANQLLYLSEQQLLDCTPGTSCENGGNPILAYQYMKGANICTEGSYAYTASKGTCDVSSCQKAIPAGAVMGWKGVKPGDTQALLEAVAQQPVAVSIDAAQTFQSYHSGVFSKVCPGDIQSINHAVLLIGYGRAGSQDYWLIKNSWGTTWGESGFARLVRGLPENGECGIKAGATYPVVDGSKVNPWLNGIPVWILVGGFVAILMFFFGIGYIIRCATRRCKSRGQRRSLVQPTPARQAPGGQQLASEAPLPAGVRTGNSRASRLLSQPSAPPATDSA